MSIDPNFNDFSSNSSKFGRTPNSGGQVMAALLLWGNKVSVPAVRPPETLTRVIVLDGVATMSVDLVDIL